MGSRREQLVYMASRNLLAALCVSAPGAPSHITALWDLSIDVNDENVGRTLVLPLIGRPTPSLVSGRAAAAPRPRPRAPPLLAPFPERPAR